MIVDLLKVLPKNFKKADLWLRSKRIRLQLATQNSSNYMPVIRRMQFEDLGIYRAFVPRQFTSVYFNYFNSNPKKGLKRVLANRYLCMKTNSI